MLSAAVFRLLFQQKLCRKPFADQDVDRSSTPNRQPRWSIPIVIGER